MIYEEKTPGNVANFVIFFYIIETETREFFFQRFFFCDSCLATAYSLSSKVFLLLSPRLLSNKFIFKRVVYAIKFLENFSSKPLSFNPLLSAVFSWFLKIEIDNNVNIEKRKTSVNKLKIDG